LVADNGLAKEPDMDWEAPTFEEIEMNAEIGSYQGDYDDGDFNGI
jgi:hypothetical protein